MLLYDSLFKIQTCHCSEVSFQVQYRWRRCQDPSLRSGDFNNVSLLTPPTKIALRPPFLYRAVIWFGSIIALVYQLTLSKNHMIVPLNKILSRIISVGYQVRDPRLPRRHPVPVSVFDSLVVAAATATVSGLRGGFFSDVGQAPSELWSPTGSKLKT